MTIGSVDIQVIDDTTLRTSIEGVVVRIFDATNTHYITQAITGPNGIAAFSLVIPGVYYVRFFKDKVSFNQPQILTALDQALNSFSVMGHVYSPPESTNPRLCRCSGFFKQPDNSAAVNHDIHFIPKFDPLLLEGNAMLTERLAQRTDGQGYVQVDLVRFGQYEVTVEGLEDQQRVITIPDLPSVNLCDLLFSVVERIEFDPPGPWNIAVGSDNDFIIGVTVYTSDGRTLPGTAMMDVQWATGDVSVASVMPTDKTIVLRGLKPGTTTLCPIRWNQSIIRIPNTPIQGTPVDINVS